MRWMNFSKLSNLLVTPGFSSWLARSKVEIRITISPKDSAILVTELLVDSRSAHSYLVCLVEDVEAPSQFERVGSRWSRCCFELLEPLRAAFSGFPAVSCPLQSSSSQVTISHQTIFGCCRTLLTKVYSPQPLCAL